jgi:hypothetical protein
MTHAGDPKTAIDAAQTIAKIRTELHYTVLRAFDLPTR